MCGIVGVIGSRSAAPVLLDALRRLEYRGYDSAGVATLVNVFNPEVVVLGGKISQSNTLFGTAVRTAKASAIGSILADAKIVRAELGDNAGIMGAAELAWRLVDGAK